MLYVGDVILTGDNQDQTCLSQVQCLLDAIGKGEGHVNTNLLNPIKSIVAMAKWPLLKTTSA